MSAWVVSKGHIDYIVSAQKFVRPGDFNVFHGGRRVTMTPTEWGKVLWTENMLSVSYRYPQDAPNELPGPISFEGQSTIDLYDFKERVDVTRMGAYKALDSLDYQSCDRPEWQETLAKAYVDTLQHSLVTSSPEYDAADTWSVD